MKNSQCKLARAFIHLKEVPHARESRGVCVCVTIGSSGPQEISAQKNKKKRKRKKNKKEKA